jgi:hypothetical protein
LRYSGFTQKTGMPSDPKVHPSDDDLGRSASIDLSIYGKDLVNPDFNIEFKQGPCTQHNFAKDLLKLYSEQANGVWFHLYYGDDKTLAVIMNRLTSSHWIFLK